MKLRALIVDDEYNCRNNLKLLLEDFCPEVEVLAIAGSAKEARIMIENTNPEIVFLDIQMPEENGFSLLKSYSEKDFSVIFTTAYNEYALKAFKANAIDYLEKPISIEELQNAVKKAIKMQGASEEEKSEKKELMQNFLAQNTSGSSKTSIPTKDGFALVDNSDIVHLQASDCYTMFYLADGRKFLSCKNIKVYEDSLGESMFFRTHKSHIINMTRHLVEFKRNEGNVAIMSNGDNVPVSRRKLPEFIERVKTL